MDIEPLHTTATGDDTIHTASSTHDITATLAGLGLGSKQEYEPYTIQPKHSNTNALDVNKSAPINLLPPEIMYLIFGFTQELYPAKARQIPLILSQVTRFWRDISLGATFLWNDIDISPPWILERVATYLERSGSHPIHLDYCVTRSITESDRYTSFFTVEELCSLIKPHLSRCRVISIKSTFSYDIASSVTDTLVASILGETLPHLQSFSLDRPGSRGPPIHFSAPVLSYLQLGGLCHLSLDFPLGSLTTLHLAVEMQYNQLIYTLALCPLLITLAIYDDHINDWPFEFSDTITETPMPNLHSLQIYGDMRDVSELLLSLSTPVLNELVIAPVVADDLILLHECLPTEPSRFPSLRSLILAPAHTYAFEAFPLAFKCFPTVKHLTFANIYRTPFSQMFANEDTTLLWPELETIALRGINHQNIELVRRMVALREDQGHPLKKLYLDALSFEHKASLDSLKSHVIVEEFDVWGIYKKQALYQDEDDRFLGISED